MSYVIALDPLGFYIDAEVKGIIECHLHQDSILLRGRSHLRYCTQLEVTLEPMLPRGGPRCPVEPSQVQEGAQGHPTTRHSRWRYSMALRGALNMDQTTKNLRALVEACHARCKAADTMMASIFDVAHGAMLEPRMRRDALIAIVNMCNPKHTVQVKDLP